MNQDDIRQECKAIVDDILEFNKKYIKHKTLFAWIFPWIKPRLDSIIMKEASYDDIKSVLNMVSKRIDKMKKQLDLVNELTDNKLVDEKINKKVLDLPHFKALKELLSDG